MSTNHETSLSVALKQVHKFAEAFAKGQDARPSFAFWLVENSKSGLISPEKSDKSDDPAMIYENHWIAYVDTVNKSTMKASSRTKGISETRLFCRFGAATTYDGLTMLTNAQERRNALVAEGQTVKPAYESFMSLARKARKENRPLTDAERDACLVPAGKAERDMVARLTTVKKLLTAITQGNETNTLQKISDISEIADNFARSALGHVDAAIETLNKNENLAKLAEMAAALGVEIKTEE